MEQSTSCRFLTHVRPLPHKEHDMHSRIVPISRTCITLLYGKYIIVFTKSAPVFLKSARFTPSCSLNVLGFRTLCSLSPHQVFIYFAPNSFQNANLQQITERYK